MSWEMFTADTLGERLSALWRFFSGSSTSATPARSRTGSITDMFTADTLFKRLVAFAGVFGGLLADGASEEHGEDDNPYHRTPGPSDPSNPYYW